ncbi:MAG: hypothetical protein DLM59_19230 [Pseudonocardiales bacterium]|nr:MAG: hypothetical protein DLM59_19230 [Pseudonocardiales bacterium]
MAAAAGAVWVGLAACVVAVTGALADEAPQDVEASNVARPMVSEYRRKSPRRRFEVNTSSGTSGTLRE